MKIIFYVFLIFLCINNFYVFLYKMIVQIYLNKIFI